MCYIRCGDTKLRMSKNDVGGDPRHFTRSIRLLNNHMYDTFYHKISGDSIRMWISHLDNFSYAIWSTSRKGERFEETV